MPETDTDREEFILDVLRRLARQRVFVLLQPGNVWVMERAVVDGEDVAEALITSWMRGWVEPISNAIPHAKLHNGNLPSDFSTSDHRPVYRLTDSGWNAINRKHSLDVFVCTVAVTSLLVSLTSLVISLFRS